MSQTTHPIAELFGPDLSRDKFCERVGMSKSHLSLMLKGRRGLSYDLAVRIEKEFPSLPAADLLKHQKAIMVPEGAAA